MLALPLLLRRLAQRGEPGRAVVTPTPFRLPRGKFSVPGELERAVAVASRRVVDRGGVVVLLDADDDCPVELAEGLRARCAAVSGAVPVAVVVAQREFEAWFLAALPSLGGHPDVTSAAAPAGPEVVRDAKGRLQEQMPLARYSPTRHQPAFVALMDLEQAGTCRSFRKLRADVEALLDVG